MTKVSGRIRDRIGLFADAHNALQALADKTGYAYEIIAYAVESYETDHEDGEVVASIRPAGWYQSEHDDCEVDTPHTHPGQP